MSELQGPGIPGDEAAGAGGGEGRSGEKGGGKKAGKPLPETGGTPPTVLLPLGTSLLAAAAGLRTIERRHGPGRG